MQLLLRRMQLCEGIVIQAASLCVLRSGLRDACVERNDMAVGHQRADGEQHGQRNAYLSDAYAIAGRLCGAVVGWGCRLSHGCHGGASAGLAETVANPTHAKIISRPSA